MQQSWKQYKPCCAWQRGGGVGWGVCGGGGGQKNLKQDQEARHELKKGLAKQATKGVPCYMMGF